MTTQVKTFTGTIIDEYGRIDGAFIAVYGVCSNAETKMEAANTTDGYVTTSRVEGISYNANYWYNLQTQLDGYRSRPLKVEEGGVMANILTVDLNHPDIQSIINSGLDHCDMVLECAMSDLNRRFI